MPNPNTLIRKGQLEDTLLSFAMSFGPIVAPANGTYVVALKTSHPLNIDEIAVQSTAGTCTVEIRINNVAVTVAGGGSTVAASSTINSKAAATLFSAGAGAKITAVIAAVSSTANLAISIKCRRT